MVWSCVISLLFHLGFKSSFLNKAGQIFCLYFAMAAWKAARWHEQSHIFQRLSKSLHSTIFFYSIHLITKQQLIMEKANKIPLMSIFCYKPKISWHDTLNPILNQGTITWALCSHFSFPRSHFLLCRITRMSPLFSTVAQYPVAKSSK